MVIYYKRNVISGHSLVVALYTSGGHACSYARVSYVDNTLVLCIGYWIHKSAIYGRIMHEYGFQYLTCCTLETTF